MQSLLTLPEVVFLSSTSKSEAIALLCDQMNGDKKLIFDAVMQREKVISTGIGIGIALPHAKLPGLEEFQITIGIVDHDGIDWESIDELPVKLIILISGPDDKHKEYLKLLSSLTKKIKEESFRNALFSSKSREEVVKIFQEC
jgi:PTS system nitrogen regulatory IIA component